MVKFDELFETINNTTDTFKDKDPNPSKQVLSVAEIKEKAGTLKLDYDAEQQLKDAEIEKLRSDLEKKTDTIATLMDKVGVIDFETGKAKKDELAEQKKQEERNLRASIGDDYYEEYLKAKEEYESKM